MKKKKIIIGSRNSKLALIYAQKVKDKILNIFNMSDQDYENISKNGRNLIVNNYSLDEFSQQIEEILLS